MKKLVLISVIFAFLIFGCETNKRDKSETPKKKNSEKVTKTQSQKQRKVNEEKLMDKKIAASAKNYEGEFSGNAIILNEKETKPLKMEGAKVYAVKMPDGNMWQVKKEGDKNMLVMPDGKLVEQKMVDGKMMLIDDDNVYQVKMINDKMIAVKTDNSTINVANK